MKYYIQRGNCIVDGDGDAIPCSDDNRDYIRVKSEIAAGTTRIVTWMPLEMPTPEINFDIQCQLLDKMWILRLTLSKEEARWFDFAVLKKT